ncbi:MAG TPA: glycoside hydrolase family 88 protein [Bryobacteraceae bacterium]|nr:glycoside hydrolase family 88 protein [Bryobacteraceae bacterium]
MKLSPLLFSIVLTFPATAAERLYVGLSGDGQRIEADLVEAASSSSPTVLLIGGLQGNDESSRAVTREVRSFEAHKPRFRLLAVPVANPGRSKLSFPPTGIAYRDNPEAHSLWRWMAIQAPDLILIAGPDVGLAEALAHNSVAQAGTIPARRIDARPGMLSSLGGAIPISEAHKEIDRRRARLPRQLAEELASYYGRDFDAVTYISGMALIARMRMGQVAEVEKLAAPYVSGAKNPLGARPNSLTLAGHLAFAELAERTGNPRYVELVRKAADLGFDQNGAMKEAMPFHDEMSDSVFMGAAILVKAGKLTGERKYFDMAARHLTFMEKLDLRPDGLYRHSPATDAAWGRGNAFPALGLALALTDFPKNHAEYGRILLSYRQLMAALGRFQDRDGMWHEVIDEAASYAETSATSMIAFSMLRGIRNGWLDRKSYQPRVDQAWKSVLARIGPQGVLMDVCESTNKQTTLEAYLRRGASLDKDARGGAMAMLFAAEMAGLE